MGTNEKASRAAEDCARGPKRDLQLVIFDCDGVLVDSELISCEVLAATLTREGLPTTPEEALREYKGLLLDDMAHLAQTRLGRPLSRGWIERFESDRLVAFDRELEPVSGAALAVERVKAAGLSVCVASQGKLEKTRLTLGLTGLLDLFPAGGLFSAYNVARGKPHPDLFLYAAATMGAEPACCAVIEDTVLGVTATVSAGMRALGYVAGGDEAELRRAGAEVMCSLDDLPTLLGI